MEKVNLNEISKHVDTQYGDLTGVIQIDGHNNIMEIYTLCKDYKFNIEDKFIVGFGLAEGSINGIGKRDEVTCSILFVEKSVYGDNYDVIEKKVRQENEISIKRKFINIKYSDLGKYIKRFDFIATNGLTKFASVINIEDRN